MEFNCTYRKMSYWRMNFNNWKKRSLAKHLMNKFLSEANFKCPQCGVSLVTKGNVPNRATFDHIIPLIELKRTTIDNLRLLCLSCNQTNGRVYESERRLMIDYDFLYNYYMGSETDQAGKS